MLHNSTHRVSVSEKKLLNCIPSFTMYCKEGEAASDKVHLPVVHCKKQLLLGVDVIACGMQGSQNRTSGANGQG